MYFEPFTEKLNRTVPLPIRLRQFDKREWKKQDSSDVLRQFGKWFVSQETHKHRRVTDVHTCHWALSSINQRPRVSGAVTGSSHFPLTLNLCDFLNSLKVKISQLRLTLFDLVDYTVHGILQGRILEWVAFPFSRGSSQPRDRTQVDSLPAEPPGKPKNTRVGSLSFLHGIFPTQESNCGLLHCRRILSSLL